MSRVFYPNLKPIFEYENCIICGWKETETVLSRKRFGLIFNLRRCKNCGLMYLHPKLSEMEAIKLYPDHVASQEPAHKSLLVLEILKKEVMPLISSYPIRVLDVACRDGLFLNILRREFTEKRLELYGVDMRPRYVMLSQRRGVKAICNVTLSRLIEDAHFPNNYFDIVLFRHSLEHLYTPRTALTETFRILKPQGFLIIEIPNIDSITRRMLSKFGILWSGLRIPWHVYHFSPRTLKKLLCDVGFNILRVKFYYSPIYIVSSFSKFIAAQFRGFKLDTQEIEFSERITTYTKPILCLMVREKKPLWRKLVSSSATLILYPLSTIFGILKVGDDMVFLCKKDSK
jgi:SAM-dependent methyltransferase